jgi:hypothetical protein
MSLLIENYLGCVMEGGLNTAKDVDFSASSVVALPSNTTINGSAVAGIGAISSSSTSATAFSVTNTGVFAGTSVVAVTANSLTTGGEVVITANGLTSGQMLSLATSATGITTTGRIFLSTHSGNAGVSAVLNEFKSAAADETVILQVLGSAALAAGKILNLSGASVTTGTFLSAANADALTTGSIGVFTSNSADTTARKLVQVINDNTAAVGAVPLYLQQDAVGTTHFKTLILLGTIGIYVSDETSPNTALTAAKGSICLNGSATGQAFWNTDGATAWTALA